MGLPELVVTKEPRGGHVRPPEVEDDRYALDLDGLDQVWKTFHRLMLALTSKEGDVSYMGSDKEPRQSSGRGSSRK